MCVAVEANANQITAATATRFFPKIKLNCGHLRLFWMEMSRKVSKFCPFNLSPLRKFVSHSVDSNKVCRLQIVSCPHIVACRLPPLWCFSIRWAKLISSSERTNGCRKVNWFFFAISGHRLSSTDAFRSETHFSAKENRLPSRPTEEWTLPRNSSNFPPGYRCLYRASRARSVRVGAGAGAGASAVEWEANVRVCFRKNIMTLCHTFIILYYQMIIFGLASQ